MSGRVLCFRDDGGVLPIPPVDEMEWQFLGVGFSLAILLRGLSRHPHPEQTCLYQNQSPGEYDHARSTVGTRMCGLPQAKEEGTLHVSTCETS